MMPVANPTPTPVTALFTIQMFNAACPTSKNGEAWILLLNKWAGHYNIKTKAEAALFLVHTGHESQDYKMLSENLRYSAKRLRQVFPKYFPTDALANSYAMNATKIGNRVYASRMGNGNEASGDGYLFRGKGLIHLTGRNNHTAFGKTVGLSAEQIAQELIHAELCVRSAFWLWQTNNLNRFASPGDIEGSTRVVNGGLNGLDDRKRRYSRVINLT